MQVFASKDAEIADLKKRLKELQEQHAPCAGGLRVLRALARAIVKGGGCMVGKC